MGGRSHEELETGLFGGGPSTAAEFFRDVKQQARQVGTIMNQTSSNSVSKLSCRNIWKVYGPDARRASQMDFSASAVDQTADKLRNAGNVLAAIDVSFDVYAGEIFVIMGLSGSGKSTMIRGLSRLVEPTHGEILFDGEDLMKASKKQLVDIRRHKMAMVFQDFGLLPHLTILDNVAFPLRVQGIDRAERLTRAAEMIELVGLKGREQAYPTQLSGGQKQRVGIARSLAIKPELWFLDEPFSALDPLIRRQMQDEFLKLQKMLKKTIVFITHDFLEALRVADRIAIMKEGRVVQIGTPSEIVLKPANEYVRKFTGDAPLAHVTSVRDVLEPYKGKLEPVDACNASAMLSDIMPHLVDNPDGFAVTDDGGEVIGEITAAKVFATLADSYSSGPNKEVSAQYD